MKKAKSSSKWTEGVLCMDADGYEPVIIFYQGCLKKHVEMDYSGIWLLKRRKTASIRSWSKKRFLELYPKSALPKKGECVEIFLEL